MPQNWSLNTGPGSLLAQKGVDYASTRRGSESNAEYRHISGADPGEDWAAELHRWAADHAYYPPQAAENGEEGVATVQVTINRYGKVLSTDLVSKSGSSFLDMAWVGEWRNATVPRFPPGTPEDTTTILYTIHYILIHRR
jgi:TonB family protein